MHRVRRGPYPPFQQVDGPAQECLGLIRKQTMGKNHFHGAFGWAERIGKGDEFCKGSLRDGQSNVKRRALAQLTLNTHVPLMGRHGIFDDFEA